MLSCWIWPHPQTTCFTGGLEGQKKSNFYSMHESAIDMIELVAFAALICAKLQRGSPRRLAVLAALRTLQCRPSAAPFSKAALTHRSFRYAENFAFLRRRCCPSSYFYPTAVASLLTHIEVSTASLLSPSSQAKALRCIFYSTQLHLSSPGLVPSAHNGIHREGLFYRLPELYT